MGYPIVNKVRDTKAAIFSAGIVGQILVDNNCKTS